jgi:hypothetical protein
MTTPTFDPIQGKAAFESLLPRYKAMAPESLATLNADAARAAIAALGIAARANEPEFLARFKSLPAKEFDIAKVEELPTIAWACWYAATEEQKGRATLSDAKLPASLVQQAVAMKARMQACCEYHLNDHPEMGPLLAALRTGTGHQDLAADLLGYAGIHRDHWDVLSTDKKHFRATDADDAVKIAEEIIAALGAHASAEGRQWADHVVRAWTLLLDTYEEVALTARWLLRHDPRAVELVPSLFAMARTRRSRKKNNSTTAPAASES